MSEEEGLDAWISAKITKASDYLSTVYHHLDYQTKFDSAGVVEGREMNPAPDMNKYGLHTTKFKGEPFKVYRHGKPIGEFDSMEEVNKFLTDLVNKESTYKETLHKRLKEKGGGSINTTPISKDGKVSSGPINKVVKIGARQFKGGNVGSVKL